MQTIKYFTDEMQQSYVDRLEKRLIKSCTDYTDKANKFVFEYDIIGDYIFCLMTCDTGCKSMPKMYRMLCRNAYDFDDIFFGGNVAEGYTLDDVKRKTKAYVNAIAKDINEIL